MNESDDDETEMEDVEKNKYVEFYSQSYASFYNTKMEKYKSILAVSAGGIGLLVTILTISKDISIFEYIIFLFASIAFIISIFTIIHIFGKNADYIIALTTESDNCDENEYKLTIFDTISTYAFGIGIALTVILGATLTYQKIITEVKIVNKENETSQTMQQINESAAGASAIKRSFSGAAKLKPKTTTQQSGNSSSTQTSNNTNPTTTTTTDKKEWCDDR